MSKDLLLQAFFGRLDASSCKRFSFLQAQERYRDLPHPAPQAYTLFRQVCYTNFRITCRVVDRTLDMFTCYTRYYCLTVYRACTAYMCPDYCESHKFNHTWYHKSHHSLQLLCDCTQGCYCKPGFCTPETETCGTCSTISTLVQIPVCQLASPDTHPVCLMTGLFMSVHKLALFGLLMQCNLCLSSNVELREHCCQLADAGCISDHAIMCDGTNLSFCVEKRFKVCSQGILSRFC